ncbi:FG-GAP-like repeat-containing protein [Seonamhaeicola marinus]|uniref:T9SS type A sorting domain-containing protein n=1 Tax=Seonamhaeicola marinus TaxID=1912246 RepID=A0A5D0IKU6_9FLAO|nr:FG-GAP-like repeat-containing protein [Seonamhaeicola marinus]TYA84176.1 T9SS type A sorting domain-containing protein [Seonamhaeicola marinus]
MKVLLRTLFFSVALTTTVFGQQFDLQNLSVFNNIHTNYGNAVADYDLDGDLDVFIVAYKASTPKDRTSWSRLLNNRNSTLEDDIQFSGPLAREAYNNDWGLSLGASWGDFNNDEYPDLLIANQNTTELYQNMQDGTFKNITATSNIESCASCNNAGGLWWDFNNDGFLDLYLYFLDTKNKLYKNNGDGTFTLTDNALGLNDPSRTWSCLPIDANNDGWLDIYVVNDFGLSKFYVNNNGASFTEATKAYNLENKGCGMGSTIGDYNNDGIFDIYVTNIAESLVNPLFKGTSTNIFENTTLQQKVGNGNFGWGTNFFDADNDGDQDLYVVNGHEDLHYKNVFFKNLLTEGENFFENWSNASKANGMANGMSTEVFDYNNDGYLDILVSNTNDKPYLYKNTTAQSNAWVQINLKGTTVNKNAVGSKVKAYVKDNTLHRFHHGASIMGQSIKPVHFGLGTAKKIDSISVSWPNGTKEVIYNIATNQKITITEQQGMTFGDNYVPTEEEEEEEEGEKDIQEDLPTNLSVNTMPNPFSNFIDFHIESNSLETSEIVIEIFTLNGIRIEKIVDTKPEDLNKWTKRWQPNATNTSLTPGIYFYNISYNNQRKIGKLVFTP